MLFSGRTYGGSDLADMNSVASAHAATVKIPINQLQRDQMKLKKKYFGRLEKALSNPLS